MEELSDINFLAVIKGQDYEKFLQKIVSVFRLFQVSIRMHRFHLGDKFKQ